MNCCLGRTTATRVRPIVEVWTAQKWGGVVSEATRLVIRHA